MIRPRRKCRRMGESVWLWTQHDERQQPCQADEAHGQDVRPGQLRQADGLRQHAGRCHQVGAADRTDGGAPDDGADGRGAPLRRDEVGSDVAAEIADAVREAGEDARGQQQHDGLDDHGAHRQHCPDQADQQAAEQAPAPSHAEHQAGEKAGGRGRADRRRGGRHAAQGRVAVDLRRHQRSDGDGGDVAGAAERGDGEQRPPHPGAQARERGGIQAPRGLGGASDRQRLLSHRGRVPGTVAAACRSTDARPRRRARSSGSATARSRSRSLPRTRRDSS